MRTTKKILLTTASALAASAFAVGAQAATPVGASTIINTGITHATNTGANFIFDVNGGTLNNSGSITNSGTGSGVWSATNKGILINSGTIATTGVAVDLGGSGQVTNTASGIITGSSGILLRADGGTVVASGFNNAGTIVASGAGNNTGGVGVSLASGVSVTGGIVNSGVIGASAANGRALVFEATASGGATTAINNTGSIVASGLGGVGISIASGAAVGTITNSGTISGGTGTNGLAIDATGVQAQTIINSGTIAGSTVLGAGNDSITNTGTITGNLTLAAGNNTVTNSKQITGAITTTGGNDTLTNNSGGIITGAVDLGNGTNTITNSGRLGSTLTGGTGADTLTNNAGASIVGAIDLEEGLNTITNSGTFGNTLTGGTATDVFTNNVGGVVTGTTDLEGGNNTVTNSGTLAALTLGGGDDTVTNNSGASMTGTLTLGNGTNTVTNAGTLAAVTGGTATDVLTNSGTITGAIDLAGGNDTMNVSAGTIGNTVTGGAGVLDALNVSGTATFVNTVQGFEDINVTAGTVNMNGAVSGAYTFDISSGAIINLGANVTADRFTNAGTLVLTASRTINGAYSQSGTLDVDFNTNGNSEVLAIASGTSTAEFLPSSILQVNVASGVTTAAASNAAAYNVITGGAAASGVANLTVASSNPLVQFTATGVGNNVQLSSSRATAAQTAANALANNGITSDAQLQSLAGGSNGGTNASSALTGYSSLLGALDTAGNAVEFNRINNAFNGLTAAQTAQALEDLGGDAGVTSANSFAVSAGVNQSNQVITAQLSDARTQMAKAPEGAAAGDAFGSDLRVWVQPFAGTFEQDRKQGVEGYESNTYGLAFGGDVSVSEMARAGVAFTYTNTDVDGTGTNAANGSEIDGYNLSFYGTYTPMTNLFIDAMVGYGYNSYDTDRFVAFLGQRAKADYNGNQYNFRLGAGYDIKADNLIVTPGAYLTYARIEQDSFTETGAGGASLAVQDQDVDRGQAGLDLTIAYPVQLQEGLLKPRISAGYAREIGDENVSSSQSFTGGGSAFTTRGADLDENVGKFGLGVDLETHSGTVFTLDGEYETRSTADGFSGFARVKAPF